MERVLTEVTPGPADGFLKLLALPTAVFVQLLNVLHALAGRDLSPFLPLLSLAQKLLGCDLDGRGCPVLDLYGASCLKGSEDQLDRTRQNNCLPSRSPMVAVTNG
jgi:hypothetical protein